jgi:3-oxoacyl-[acyl-carrier protein] reductase
MQIANAVVLVTGGSSGIGRSIAETLGRAGAKVAITGRDRAKLSAAASAVGAHAIQADVSKEDDAARAVRDAIETFGHLDVLVNNAGMGVLKPLVDMDAAGFDRVWATNVRGAMLMAREAARHFVTRNAGAIVNIGSTASHRGAPNGTAYYASKFALRGMTECWRQELRKFNVRVMLVNPSEVITNFAAVAGFEQKAHPSKLQPEDIAHAVKGALEMADRGFTTELTVFATNPQD